MNVNTAIKVWCVGEEPLQWCSGLLIVLAFGGILKEYQLLLGFDFILRPVPAATLTKSGKRKKDENNYHGSHRMQSLLCVNVSGAL
jgi:hypothetical protein